MTQTLLFGILILCASYTIGVDTYNDDVIDTLHEVKIMDHISIPQHDLILGTLSCQSGALCADTKNEDHVLPRVVLRDNSVHDDELMYHPEDHPEDHHDHHHDDNDDHHDDDHHDDHDHDHEKKDLVPLRVIKGIGAANLFIMSMVFGYAPRLLKLVKHQWVSYINLFGGGVIFMCAILYLLPELGEGIHDMEHELGTDYPLSFLFIALGYLLLLLLEHVLTEHTHEHHEAGVSTLESHTQKRSEEDSLLSEKSGWSKKKLISTIFFGFTLGMHAIIEAIIVGAQKDVNQAFVITLAILSHKWVESFSFGLLMFRNNAPRIVFFLFLLTFSLIAPIGVGIGVLVESKMSTIVAMFFNGLAVGTFIYLGTTEIIAEEFSHSSKKISQRILKFVCVVLGCLLICLLRLWIKHSHGDDHSHPHPHTNST